MTSHERTIRDRAGVIVGLLLVILGVFFLLAELSPFNIWGIAWPFFVIIPGLLLFIGMVLGGRDASVLAVPASIVTTAGLLLFYQNALNHWQSWAYAWSLIFPTSVGIGLLIHGILTGEPTLAQNGRRLIALGLVVFLAGFVFFELLLNISGLGGGIIRTFVAPILLIAIGVYLLIRRTSITTCG